MGLTGEVTGVGSRSPCGKVKDLQDFGEGVEGKKQTVINVVGADSTSKSMELIG